MTPLTPREIEVLKTYCEHETHEEAAEHLRIGVQTLKNHLSKIYRKVGVRKAHAAVYRLGLTNRPVFSIGPSVTQTMSTSITGQEPAETVMIRNATYYPGVTLTASGTNWVSMRYIDHGDGSGHYEGEPS